MVLLTPIECATRFLSASDYPTHGDVRCTFLGILKHLFRHMNDDNFSQRMVARSIYQKLADYWLIIDEPSQISALLDPRVKFTAFNNEIEKGNAKNLILNLTEYFVPLATETVIEDVEDDIVATRDYFRRLQNNMLNLPESGNVSSSRTISDELERYLMLPLENRIDPLLWWQVKQEEFPILCKIARDYLCIQATSVPSEQAFSIAGLTISPLRNRLEAETARITLCLKSWLRKKIC